MGWQDRDYAQADYDDGYGAGRLGIQKPPPTTLALMIIHGAAAVLMLMLWRGEGAFIVRAITLGTIESRSGDSFGIHPLGIVLHPFATINLLSAVFAVLVLWSLGGRVERALGGGRYLVVYCLGNLAAGLAYFAIGWAAAALARNPLDYPVGALAGLLLLVYHQMRHEPVNVFGRMTTGGKVYLICAAIVVGFALLSHGLGSVAWLAGVAAGAGVGELMRRGPIPTLPTLRRRSRVVQPSISRGRPRSEPDDSGIDEILAKISRHGMAQLSDAERRKLEEAREAKLRESR